MAGSDAAPREPQRTPFAQLARKATPIRVSRGVRNVILLAVVAALGLLVWAVPLLLVAPLGGFMVALLLAPPVSLFSRAMPRSLAITLVFLIGLALLLVVFYVLVPLVAKQVGAFVGALPNLIQNIEKYSIGVLRALDGHGLLPGSPEDMAASLGENLKASLGAITGDVLGGTLGLVFGTFNFVLTLFAIVFVAMSLLLNVRRLKAAYLASVPRRYRADAQALWRTLDYALTRYVGGLSVVLVIQGALSAAALSLIGVPYALALGTWVSITAVIPYLGVWIGALPAVLVAFSISPTAAVLTVLAFLAIQALEGNFLTPRIQGQTIRVPSVIIFLAVVAGGELAGVLGVLVAVPMLAVFRVLFDFFRVRLRVSSR